MILTFRHSVAKMYGKYKSKGVEKMFIAIVKALTNNIFRLVVAILKNEGINTEGWPTELI